MQCLLRRLRAAAESAVIADGRSAAEYRLAQQRNDIEQQVQWQKQVLRQQMPMQNMPPKIMSKQTVQNLFHDDDDADADRSASVSSSFANRMFGDSCFSVALRTSADNN